MGNLCSSPQNQKTFETPGDALTQSNRSEKCEEFQKEIKKITLSRVDEEDSANAGFNIDTEKDTEGTIKTIMEELFNKQNWEYAECSKEDFKGAFALCLECADESSLQVFVGKEATSVLPEFDITAEKQMAHKSLSPSSLYDLINKLYESNSKLPEETSEVEDASSSEQPQENIDEFDEPAEPVQTENQASSI